MSQEIKLLVGLGNPGMEYAQTRHNVGAWWIDLLVAEFGGSLRVEKKCFGRVARVSVSGSVCHLLIPDTFMNNSGQSVQAAAHFYKILPSEILVAHDDLDFPVGTLRLKQGGGHGGHNGLRDMVRALSSRDFMRLRIGIGRSKHESSVSSYVLARPSAVDADEIQAGLRRAVDLLPDLLQGEWDRAVRTLHL